MSENPEGPVAWAFDARDLFEGAPDAMLIVDAAGKVVQVNAETERMFGWPRGELVGQPIEVLVPERVRAAHVVHRTGYAGSARRRGMGMGMELRGVRRDGTELAVEVALSPFVTTDRGTFVLAAVRDVSDRKAAERAAQVALERLVSALESSQDAFAIFDREDRLVLCNSAYRRSLPTTLEGAIVGARYEALLEATSTLARLDEPLEAFRARLRAYHSDPQGSFEMRTTDGRSLRIVERVTPERGRILTIADLTEDVRREEELRTAQQAAETANAAKTEFLRSMSHELRTPLNAVLGFTQLLQRDASLGERPRRFVDHVHRGGEHLLRLIDDVLDLARVESGAVPLSLEPVDPRELLDDVRATLAPLAERRGMSLRVVSDSVPPSVRADRTRLRQIVLNFGSNALKYGKEGGHVALRVQPAEGRVRIVVEDDGPGIPVDRQDKLFQAFYRAGQETGPIEGTGIGLALSRRLAEMMGGTVGFTSLPGNGSSFWVELGEVTAGAAEAPAAHAQPATPSSSTAAAEALVLYVEDNPANVAFMEELMSGIAGVKLLVAPTGEIGLELARAHRPAVVILDINLPGISGFEVLRRLRSDPATGAVPVIALSASAMERDVKRAEEAGFTKYLTKPVRVDELTQTLARLLPR